MSQRESPIADTPVPPYVAVIFTSRRTPGDNGYAEMAVAMDALARDQSGYLGMESVRDGHDLGITVSYWIDEHAARRWKQVSEHLGAQRLGREVWYRQYKVRIATITRDYGFPREESGRGSSETPAEPADGRRAG
jgi:heme-degrading monooxygenase HmoA